LATIGHNYPLYYRFKGGRGLSTIYGGFIVLDWVGVLVTNIGGILLGGLMGQALFMRYAGLLLMIPWIWFRTQDVTKLVYVLVANAMFWFAILPELRQVLGLRQAEERPDEQRIAEIMGMGGVYGLVKRFRLANLIGQEKKADK
jgi:glycerol-3-phosphate acyltransferase PlsY